jgi:hypothetical protein
MPLSSPGHDPGAEAELKHRRERFMRKADAARAARLAGRRSLVRRLMERARRRCSHVPTLSHPDEVIDITRAAAAAV